MNKGLIWTLIASVVLLAPSTFAADGQIWKVVDENGNVTYTDKRPADGAEPMDLPELSVIETDVQVPATPTEDAEADGDKPLTTRELRRKYRDFRITAPAQEETFWGTANTVVVSWGASEEISEELSVVLEVDGAPRPVESNSSVALVLERGEHTVRAILQDARGRQIIASETVTFFVKQNSARFG